MIDPFGESHLAGREPKPVLLRRHHLRAGLQISTDRIEVPLRRRVRQIILGAQRCASHVAHQDGGSHPTNHNCTGRYLAGRYLAGRYLERYAANASRGDAFHGFGIRSRHRDRNGGRADCSIRLSRRALGG